MISREIKNNAYAKFWRSTKSIMVFLKVAYCRHIWRRKTKDFSLGPFVRPLSIVQFSIFICYGQMEECYLNTMSVKAIIVRGVVYKISI